MMKTLLSYLRRHFYMIVALALSMGVFAGVFSLYSLPVEAVLYSVLLTLAVFVVLGIFRFTAYSRKHKRLEELRGRVFSDVSGMPEPGSVIEEDYQQIISTLYAEKNARITRLEKSREEAQDYYTLWAHQIKTPIAAMDLLLQTEGSRGDMAAELLKIQQYVEMALGYVRMGSEASDYVLRQCSLDDVVRQCVRKFARLFVLKKLTLSFSETGLTVLTDEKWLSFAIEQLLSNALKYTSSGGISICAEGMNLVISDTGIGIREEDLPRVCQKGFTGYNGREDKRSTGIGLYLCASVLTSLGHTLRLQSQVGEGTRAVIGLERKQVCPE